VLIVVLGTKTSDCWTRRDSDQVLKHSGIVISGEDPSIYQRPLFQRVKKSGKTDRWC
jgi:hypothetical protein